ncbi:MAG TPA: lysylphosphatidylglycerol synthase domain-containing protein [Steroidobacteraceae bacterium]|nr:lysylphosphatidylglycerol synthase domain-containing protein [Steroidobacteraceae bacterium]
MSAPDAVSVDASARGGRSERLRILIVAALGLALAAYLLGHIGFRAVLAAATSVGWSGFALLCAWAFVVFALLAPAWYVLQPRASHPRLAVFIAARMVRDAVSEALPFSQVGGMILGVRAASVLGVPTRLAVGSMIVDVTTELLGQIAYVALGLVILSARAADNPLAHALVRSFLIGLSLVTLGGLGFLTLQHRSMGWVSGKLAARLLPASAAYTAPLAATLREIYRSPMRVVLSVMVHFCAWTAAGVGTWVAFRLIGVHMDVASGIAIDSLVYGVRSLAFFVPNALGVQEAAYALLAPLVGVGKEYALAVSLLRRARDIAIGIPIVLVWQLVESRRALARRTRGGAAADPLDLGES